MVGVGGGGLRLRFGLALIFSFAKNAFPATFY